MVRTTLRVLKSPSWGVGGRYRFVARHQDAFSWKEFRDSLNFKFSSISVNFRVSFSFFFSSPQ